MITPTLKDEILKFIVVAAPDLTYAGELEELAEQFKISTEVVKAVLRQFHQKGLIKYTPFLGGGFMLQISADAHDYILKGGHLGEFEYLEMQVQKLKNDLYSFESSVPKEKFSNVMNTLNTILSATSAYNSFK